MEGDYNSTTDFLSTWSTESPLQQSLYTYPELVFCAVGFTIIILGIFFGNSLVLVAVARTKKLQNVTNVFVVNLSVSDCLTGFAFLWSVPGMVSTTPGYPLGSDVPCTIWAALVYLGVGGGLYSLANIALNRCILVVRSETYKWLYTPKQIALMVLTSWLVPLSAIIIPPLSGAGGLGFDPDSRTCTDLDTLTNAATFDRILFFAFYPIPLLIIVVSYVLIWRHVRRHFKTYRKSVRQRMQAPVAMPSTVTLDIDTGGTGDSCPETPPVTRPPRLQHAVSSRQLARTKNDQVAITKNLFVVVFAFIVCFTPLGVMIVIDNNRFQLYAGMILFVSGCINPILYATKHPHFRPVLRSMLLRRCATE